MQTEKGNLKLLSEKKKNENKINKIKNISTAFQK